MPPVRTSVSPVSAESEGEPMQLDEQVKDSWKRWNKQLLNDDAYGHWFAFTLTTHLTDKFLWRKFERRCAFAMNANGLEPPLLPTDAMPTRTDIRKQGVVVFVLPSVSREGHKHFHGMCRTPMNQPLTTLTIWETNKPQNIVVPMSLRQVFEVRFGKGVDGTFRNINILHDQVPCEVLGMKCQGTALPLDSELDIASHRVLNYWNKTKDGEHRDFSNGEWVPHWVRHALPSADTTRVPDR